MKSKEMEDLRFGVSSKQDVARYLSYSRYLASLIELKIERRQDYQKELRELEDMKESIETEINRLKNN